MLFILLNPLLSDGGVYELHRAVLPAQVRVVGICGYLTPYTHVCVGI
jgi:hypothetical protein